MHTAETLLPNPPEAQSTTAKKTERKLEALHSPVIYLGLYCLTLRSYLPHQGGGRAPCPHRVPTDAEDHLGGQRAH